MTGRMSDNPADSLRRELEAAAFNVLCSNKFRFSSLMHNQARYIVADLEPLVSAALEAARADERERARRQAFTEAAAAIDERVVGSPPGAKRRRTGRSFYSGLVAAREIVRPLAEGQPPGQYQIPEAGA